MGITDSLITQGSKSQSPIKQMQSSIRQRQSPIRQMQSPIRQRQSPDDYDIRLKNRKPPPIRPAIATIDWKQQALKIKNIFNILMKSLDGLNQDLKEKLNELKKKFDECLRNPKTRKGINFISSMNEKNETQGVGIYRTQNGESKSFTVGSQVQGVFQKPFLTIDYPFDTSQIKWSALFIAQANNNGICCKTASNDVMKIFIGLFNSQNEMQKGLLKELDGMAQKKFQGSFKNGFFHGEGQLRIGNSSKYKGNFQKGKKDGFGVLLDFEQNIQYVGQFEANQPHGYGEITYSFDRKRKSKWKGFWNEGVNEQGVFVDCEIKKD